MTISTRLGAALLAAATATGCATNESGEKSWLDQKRDQFANAISTQPNRTQNGTDAQGGTATTSANANNTVTTKKGPSVTWGDASCQEKLSGNQFALASRRAAASLTSLNSQCIAAKVADTTPKSKTTPVINYGKISLESCSPDLVAKATSGFGAFIGGLVDTGAAALGKAAANKAGSVGGGVLAAPANVARNEAQRAGTDAANAAKNQVKGTIAGLTPEQNNNCAADTKTLSDAIKADVKGFEDAFKAANKGAKTIVTYSADADITSLNLGVTAAPTRAPAR